MKTTTETIKREKKKEEAVVNIYTSFNKTLDHITDRYGKTKTGDERGLH